MNDYLERFARERPLVRQNVPLRDGETPEQFGLHLAVLELEDGTPQEVYTNAFGTVIIPVGYRQETDAELRVRIERQIGRSDPP